MRLLDVFFIFALAACGGSGSSSPNLDAGGAAACVHLGAVFCHQLYACYSADDRLSEGLPATEAECVTAMNAHCGDATPSPGYCKGSPELSEMAATDCATDLDGMTCAQFTGTPPPDDVCKHHLCAM